MKVFSWQFLYRILITVLVFTVSWSLAFLLTNMLHLDKYVPAYFLLLINSFVGFVFFGILVRVAVKIFSLDRHDLFLQPMIEAMEHISHGNFSVDLSEYKEKIASESHPYYKVIRSIEQMAEELSELEQMRQEFISNVSHEIQSPLTSISGFAFALQQKDMREADRHHYLQIIQTECMRLSKLSENLLKLTTLESDKVPLSLQDYRLDTQLRDVILSLEPQWTEKRLEVDVRLKNKLIHADQSLMAQVWMNMIHNSIKFTPDDGQIVVRMEEKHDNTLCVVVQDTGIGMSSDAKMHVFERFYKADQSRNRNGSGSGLGLSIVHKIVQLHGGSVEVESELGIGTTLTVLLPHSRSL